MMPLFANYEKQNSEDPVNPACLVKSALYFSGV
jgi:hypothetical protein